MAGTANQEHIRGSYFWDVFIDPGEREDVRQRFRDLAPDFAPGEYQNTFTNENGERPGHLLAQRTRPRARTERCSASSPAASTSPIASCSLEEMERERAFLNAIANNAPSLLSLIDETGRVVDLATNIAFEQTLEYAPAETGGHLFWERYIDPAEADDVKAILERVFAGEVVGEHDHHWVTSTGRRLLIAWTCTALPSLDDRTLFLISGVDVTERVEREQEVQRRRDFLNAITRAVPSFLIAVEPDASFVEEATQPGVPRDLRLDGARASRARASSIWSRARTRTSCGRRSRTPPSSHRTSASRGGSSATARRTWSHGRRGLSSTREDASSCSSPEAT